MPLATPIVSVNASTLKLGVLPMLAAGLEHARLMGPVKLAAIWATTGMIEAWRLDVQSKIADARARRALRRPAHGGRAVRPGGRAGRP
mmetsp:Transcript_18940/g.65087  ORF Transcript_18940/g.65087 Transcript_18940/m.65087 type:complete len:88 (+) Transcript_18940:614-877(+)